MRPASRPKGAIAIAAYGTLIHRAESLGNEIVPPPPPSVCEGVPDDDVEAGVGVDTGTEVEYARIALISK